MRVCREAFLWVKLTTSQAKSPKASHTLFSVREPAPPFSHWNFLSRKKKGGNRGKRRRDAFSPSCFLPFILRVSPPPDIPQRDAAGVGPKVNFEKIASVGERAFSLKKFPTVSTLCILIGVWHISAPLRPSLICKNIHWRNLLLLQFAGKKTGTLSARIRISTYSFFLLGKHMIR